MKDVFNKNHDSCLQSGCHDSDDSPMLQSSTPPPTGKWTVAKSASAMGSNLLSGPRDGRPQKSKPKSVGVCGGKLNYYERSGSQGLKWIVQWREVCKPNAKMKCKIDGRNQQRLGGGMNRATDKHENGPSRYMTSNCVALFLVLAYLTPKTWFKKENRSQEREN